jgi:hypothetical protein
MANNKAATMWGVNVLAFIFLVVLTLTGLINWLVLPRGYAGSGGLVSLRHFLRDVHEWTALLFLISIAIHWALHWTYIKSNLKRHGILKK